MKGIFVVVLSSDWKGRGVCLKMQDQRERAHLFANSHLTCILALIKNRGFPREAKVECQATAAIKHLSSVPPTAPLEAPANTEVNVICSSGENPMKSLIFLRKGS